MGTYTVLLAPHCKHVYAFEAQRRTFYQLCGSVALNNLKNVDAHHIAVGAAAQCGTTMDLHVTSIDGGGSSLREDAAAAVGKDIATERVHVRCLDSYGLKDVGLIKIDVEGFEYNVLDGARGLLQECRPNILLEAWTDAWYAADRARLAALLNDLDYDVVALQAPYTNMWLASPRQQKPLPHGETKTTASAAAAAEASEDATRPSE